MKKEVEVTFETITPLWTGDAWQNTIEIRPSPLVGSLRFWFETIMYFADILSNKDFNHQNGRFEKEVDRRKLKEFVQKNGNDIKEIVKHLINDQQIPLSSVIFGTTNWRSLIEIKDIFDINNFSNYKYYLGTMKFPELKHNDKIPTWYFKKGFYGDFQIKFLVEEKIIDSIFYPLLTFMDKYGFWGGKWNIGYGRLKLENLPNTEEKFDLEIFNIREESDNFFILEVDNFSDLIKFNDKKIKWQCQLNCVTPFF